MFDSAIELVKLVGGLGGLASSAFLIYDRVFRSRPLAFLVPADYRANVRFKNVADETIVVDEVVVKPPVLKLARANDLVTRDEERQAMYDNAKAKMPKEVFVIIKPLGERSFALDRFAEFENAANDTVIEIRCRWRHTRKPFPVSRYVRIKTTKKEIVDLREASLAGKT